MVREFIGILVMNGRRKRPPKTLVKPLYHGSETFVKSRRFKRGKPRNDVGAAFLAL